ncbi:uncharacterized protein LOC106051507 isoform X2 [Biomphalaria glabrata]|nr:uncharacterized protein LOC106051507 isoform X2 [Biomphalaria glabrata]
MPGEYYKICYLENKEEFEIESEISTLIGDNSSTHNIKYQVLKLKEQEYIELCYIHLHICQGRTRPSCFCHNTTIGNVYSIVINFMASKELSNARLRGAWTLDRGVLYSEVRILPTILDLNEPEMLVFLNGNLINQSECQETVDVSNVDIYFIVQKVLPQFCFLKIKDLHSNQTVEKECSVLHYSTSINETREMEFTLYLCNNTEYTRSFTCTISLSNPSIGKLQNCSLNVINNVLLAFCVVFFCASMVMAPILIKQNVKKWRKAKMKKKRDQVDAQRRNNNEEEKVELTIQKEI